MAAGYDGSIRIDTNVNTKGYNQGLKSISGGLTKIKGSLGGIAAAAGVAFGIAGLVNFSKQALSSASDLTEVENVVNTAFGSMSDQVDAWSKNSIKQFGMSELSAKRTASTYMAMNAGMGIVGQGAADMAMSVAERTADIASFYNMTQEEADTMMKSIWTGETESLKRIGVVMTQVNLQEYARQQGITKSIDAMTQAEQVQLRYGFAMQQTNLAAGDFAKTSGSWANQTRILSEQWKQFLTIMGGGLIKVLTPALQFLNTIMDALISVANMFAGVMFGSDLQAQVKQQQAASQAIQDTAASQDALADSTKKANKETKGQTADFDKIHKLSSGSSDDSSSGVSMPAITPKSDSKESGKTADKISKQFKKAFDDIKKYISDTFGPSFKIAFQNVAPQLEKLKKTFQGVWEDIKSLGSPLKEWFSGDFTTFLQTNIKVWSGILGGLLDSFNRVFSDIWNIVIFPFLQLFSTTILPIITQVATQITLTLGTLFSTIKTIFDTVWTEGMVPALQLFQKIFTDVWMSIDAAWKKWGQPIFDNLRLAIKNIGEIFMNVWTSFLKPVWDNIISIVDNLWTKHIKPLVDNVLDFIGELVNGALTIYNKFIAPIVNWLVKTLGPVFADIFNGIANVVGTAIGIVVDVINGVITTLKGLVQFIVGVFTGDWEKAWTGIKNFFKGIWDAIWGIVKGAVNLIIDGINLLWKGIYTVVKGIVNSIGGIAGAIGDLFGKDWHFSMPEKPPLIPKLAKGAVIPPNQQFAAILGDQKHGRNLEAPEGLIRKIVREESGNGSPPQIVVNATGEMAPFVRQIKYEIDQESWRQGKSLANKVIG